MPVETFVRENYKPVPLVLFPKEKEWLSSMGIDVLPNGDKVRLQINDGEVVVDVGDCVDALSVVEKLATFMRALDGNRRFLIGCKDFVEAQQFVAERTRTTNREIFGFREGVLFTRYMDRDRVLMSSRWDPVKFIKLDGDNKEKYLITWKDHWNKTEPSRVTTVTNEVARVLMSESMSLIQGKEKPVNYASQVITSQLIAREARHGLARRMGM